MAPRPSFGFGPFVLDLDHAELRRDGRPVRLPPQPFAALTLLVERAGSLVTRDELRRVLWGDDHFVDVNAGVNFCIAQIRAALDDPAARSACIVAIPRRGYRFVAAVQRIEVLDRRLAGDAASADAIRRVPPPPARASRGRIPAAVASVLLTAALVMLAIGWPGEAAVLPPLAASQSYERGAQDLLDASPAELRARVGYFEDAMSRHPRFAAAYAGLADAKLLLGLYREEATPDAFAAAKAAAAHAVALDPESAEAHAALGAALLFFEWDWARARTSLERAAALDPRSTRVQQWYSRYLSAAGRHDEALAHARIAVDRAPGSPSALTSLGLAAFYAGRFADAVRACEDAAALMKEFIPARQCALAAAAEAGDLDRAARHIVSLIAPSPEDAGRLLPAVFAGGDARAFWRARADRMRSGSRDGHCECDPVSLAVSLTHAGDREGALQSLELAANRHTDTLVIAGVHPAFAELRGEPRFGRVLARLGRR